MARALQPAIRHAEPRTRNGGTQRCKDCVRDGITTARKMATKPDGTLQPGPRCVTHHRAFVKASKLRAHAIRVRNNFEITGEEYWAIYAAQDGMCAICLRAKGKSKRLCVDHDHNCPEGHDPKMGCRKCIRALLCTTCNHDLLGKYDVPALLRAILVLQKRPAQKVLSELAKRAQP